MWGGSRGSRRLLPPDGPARERPPARGVRDGAAVLCLSSRVCRGRGAVPGADPSALEPAPHVCCPHPHPALPSRHGGPVLEAPPLAGAPAGGRGVLQGLAHGAERASGVHLLPGPGTPPSQHRDPPESWPAVGVALGDGLRVCPPPTGSLIQVPMSEKGKITRGRLGSLSLKKEGERQCFLFSKHLIICTRGSGGKLHLTKVRAAGAAEARGGHHHGGPADPGLGPRRRAGDQTHESAHVCAGLTSGSERAGHSRVFCWRNHGEHGSACQHPLGAPDRWCQGRGPGGLDRPLRGARVCARVCV